MSNLQCLLVLTLCNTIKNMDTGLSSWKKPTPRNQYLDVKSLYEFYHYQIWNNRFAKVLLVAADEKMLQEE